MSRPNKRQVHMSTNSTNVYIVYTNHLRSINSATFVRLDLSQKPRVASGFYAPRRVQPCACQGQELPGRTSSCTEVLYGVGQVGHICPSFDSDHFIRGGASGAKVKYDDVILEWFGPLSHPTRRFKLALKHPSESV